MKAGSPALGGAFALLFAAESWFPLRPRVERRGPRTLRNLALGALAGLVHGGAVIPAMTLASRRGGIARRSPGPAWARDVVAFALLDYTTYLWHRANHASPLLFRFHAVHHADRDLDVSTAARFHPGEIALSIAASALAARIVGPRPEVAVAYALAMQIAAAFHHSNLRLPERLDRALAALVVTPRMHGIHHSARRAEADSNWSVIFSVWDRLHGTLRRDVPPSAIPIGLPDREDAGELGLWGLLRMPFERGRAG